MAGTPGTPVTVSAPGPLAVSNTTTSVEVTLAAAIDTVGSTLQFQLTVTDSATPPQSNTATATVTIVGQPVVTINPGKQDVAAGQPFQLSADVLNQGAGIVSYTWELLKPGGDG
ncbi:MAG: hypothetical protein WCC84_07175 [Candidatus Cybelea sp.]